MLQAAALGKHIFDITDSELDIGWLGLAEFMPAVLLVLVTGTVADRLNRKKISLLAQFQWSPDRVSTDWPNSIRHRRKLH